MDDEKASVRDWTDILRRVRLGATVTVPGNTRGVRGSTVRAVALMLATYADADGSRVFPGTARVAVACEIDYRTAKRCLASLRHLGLIVLVRPARQRHHADEYRLTIPTDLMERMAVLSPTEMESEVEEMRANNRRGERPTGAGRTRTLRVPDAPVEAPVDEPRTGAGSTPTGPRTGAGSTAVRVPECPPTHHYIDTRTTHHSDEDLSTDVAGPRAVAAEEDFDSEVVGRRPPALRLIEGALGKTIPEELRADVTKGNGWCLACYAAEPRQYVVAADPVAGSACTYHLRSAAG